MRFKVNRDKLISKRAILRGFQEEPLPALLECILANAFEYERGIPWFALLVEVDEQAKREGSTKVVDIVLDAMVEGMAKGLIVEDGGILRIPEEKYQMAMDIAGVWYPPYEPNGNESVYGLTEKGAMLLEKYGLDGLAQILASLMSEEKKD